MTNMKTVTMALGLAASMFASQACASLITVTETGTIGYGFDYGGSFSNNVVGTNLAGKAFTLSITLDVDLLQYESTSPDGLYRSRSDGRADQKVIQTVTVNGVTKSFEFALSNPSGADAQTRLSSYSSTRGHGLDEAFIAVNSAASTVYSGNLYKSQYIIGSIYVGSERNAMDLTADFHQSFSYIPTADDYQFAEVDIRQSGSLIRPDDLRFSAYGGRSGNRGSITSITWSPSNNVPEPESLALVGLGLLGLAFSRRRQG